MNTNCNMRKGYVEAESRPPTLEQIKEVVVKNLKNVMISCGRKAVDSVTSRLLTMQTASTSLLNGRFDEEISSLTSRAQDDVKDQSTDNKQFSTRLIEDINRITNIILIELNKPIT